MYINQLLDISESEKKIYRDFFVYETMLVDTEEDLKRDFDYYNKRLKAIEKADSAHDFGMRMVYKTHLNSIQHLLDVLEDLKTSEFEPFTKSEMDSLVEVNEIRS